MTGFSLDEWKVLESDVRETVSDFLEPSQNSSKSDTVTEAGEIIEEQVADFFDERYDNVSVYGEEGTRIESREPDTAVLVDPVDGSSAALSGNRDFIATGITGLETLDADQDSITGRPVFSYIIQHGGAKGTYLAENGQAFANGEIRWPGHLVEWSDLLPDSRHQPRPEKSLEDISKRPGLLAAYAAKPSRDKVRENILEPVAEEGNYRYSVWGGVMNDIRVGTGENLASFEPLPTKPSEAAGAYWASCMGAEWRDMHNQEVETIEVNHDGESFERTYHGFVSPNPEIADEVYDVMEEGEIMESTDREYNQQAKPT